MSAYLGKEFLIYSSMYGNWSLLGCNETCTLIVSAEEINTTTKGSGRGTNRELGRYDWSLSSSDVVVSTSDIKPIDAIDPIKKGTKVLVKGTFDGTHQGSFFGRGVITSVEITGGAEGVLTANMTIKADGDLFLPADLVTTWTEGKRYEYTTTGSTSYIEATELYLKDLAFVVVDDVVYDPATNYTFNDDNGAGKGRIDFTGSPIPSGKLIEVYYW